MSYGTRNEVKKAVCAGRVTVNGETVLKPATKVNEDTDMVCVDGREILYSKYEYFMLNKPAGYVSATTDNMHKTVTELIKDSKRNDIFPVGRLDIDTEGLLLITNDGPLAHALLSPHKHIDKTYFLVADSIITESSIKLLEDGIDIGDEKAALPAKTSNVKYFGHESINGTSTYTSMELTLHEGRYHQVKRMIQAAGSNVVYLKRIRMGALELDKTLPPGGYRRLTAEEMEKLGK